MSIARTVDTHWKRIVAILTAGWIVIWIYRTALTPIYPVISKFFGGVSDAALGSISSFYFLGYVIMQIPSGLLVDRFGQRRVIIPGFSVFALGTLVVALATELPMMYVGSVLAGIGCGTFYGVAYSLTAEYVPEEKKSLSTAVVNSGMAVGSGFGLVSSSFLVGRGIIPWQWLVLATTVLCVAMLVVFGTFIKAKPAAGADAGAGEAAGAAGGAAAAAAPRTRSLRDLFAPQMIAAYVLYFSTMYAYYLIDTWLPNFLETERGFAGTAVGLASSLVFFSAIPGALVFSRLADKIPHRKVAIIVVLELVAAGMLMFTMQAPNQTLVVVGIVAYGFFGKLAVEPIIISWLSQFASGGSVATMYGVFNFFGMTSSVLAPTVTGAISDATGSKIVGFYLAVCIILAGTALFFIVNRVCSAKRAAA